jgi:hypothetical protein
MKLRLALLAAIVLVPALLAFGVLRLAASGDRAPAEAPAQTDGEVHEASAPDRWLGGALDPGPLAAAHAELGGVSHCLDCHGSASEVLDARCVACHAEIGERAAKSVAWHGTFREPCRTCHAEHRGSEAALIDLDRDAFQHQLTRFPLRGEHATADCEECHQMLPLEGDGAKAFHYQGVPFASCAGCHVDPPRPPKGRSACGGIRQSPRCAPPRERSAEHPIAGRDRVAPWRGGFAASRLRAKRFDHTSPHFRLDGARAQFASRHIGAARRGAR